MPQDADPIHIGIAVEENRTVYVLAYQGKSLKSFPTAAEAIAARVELEKQIKQEEKQ
jgi:hypothetical protein